MKSAGAIMLQIQRNQQAHDLIAHRDILQLDTQTRIKHMTLHFLKYAGKIANARGSQDIRALESVLVDIIIICLATANTLNVNLGATWMNFALDLRHLARELDSNVPSGDIFDRSLTQLVQISGKMAKSIESMDHLELGNPRAELEGFIVELTAAILSIVGELDISIEELILNRWRIVEAKSIFSGAYKNSDALVGVS